MRVSIPGMRAVPGLQQRAGDGVSGDTIGLAFDLPFAGRNRIGRGRDIRDLRTRPATIANRDERYNNARLPLPQAEDNFATRKRSGQDVRKVEGTCSERARSCGACAMLQRSRGAVRLRALATTLKLRPVARLDRGLRLRLAERCLVVNDLADARAAPRVRPSRQATTASSASTPCRSGNTPRCTEMLSTARGSLPNSSIEASRSGSADNLPVPPTRRVSSMPGTKKISCS